MKRKSLLELFRSITLQEWITCGVLAASLGVAFWSWTIIHDLVKPFLKPLGLKYLLAGFWLISSVFLSYLIRKPGVALFASIIAALVEGMITQWGLGAVLYGFIQGLGAEIIFLLFAYRIWSLPVLCAAATMSALTSYAYDYLTHDYHQLSLSFNLVQLITFIFSAIIFAAILSRYLAKRLVKTGLLDTFLIAQDKNHE